MDTPGGGLKAEWKSYVIILLAVGILLFLVHINGQIEALKKADQELRSNIGSVESLVIGTDANVADLVKKVDKINSNVNYIVRKVRRR